jgi:cytoskeletal protein CcmA (bactofilin family)
MMFEASPPEPRMWNQQAPSKREDTSQVQTTGPAASAGRPTEERRITAWIGKSVVFKGELSSAEDLTFDGHLEGTIDVGDHSLTIGPDADIEANITGKVVIVHGHVKGKIAASEKIHLQETASVDGELTAPKFVMGDGARVVGRMETVRSPVDAHSQSPVPVPVPVPVPATV